MTRRRFCLRAFLCLGAVVLVAAFGASAAGARGASLRVLADVEYAGPRGPTLDAYYRPDSERARAAVLVVHGGSWQRGDKRRMTGVSRQLANAGFAVFNVNYTLAREGRPGFPGQMRELRAAVRWVRARAGRLRVDPRRIGAFGSSAGGHLVGLLATRAEGSLQGGHRVRAAAVWSAPLALDRLRPGAALGQAAHRLVGCDGGDCSERLTEASPVTYVSDDDPDMLIVASTREVVPFGQATRMAAHLAEADVPHRLRAVAGHRHGMDLAAEMIGPTIAFLSERLRPAQTITSAR